MLGKVLSVNSICSNVEYGAKSRIQNVPAKKSPYIISDFNFKKSQRIAVAEPYTTYPITSPIKYIEKYINPNVIRNALKLNPTISDILESNGLEPEIYEINIDENLKRHSLTTYFASKAIAQKINLDWNSQMKLYQASLLHDIGKALIPEKIIQKPRPLTKEEHKIVDLHSRLGYEILKTTDVDYDVMKAVEFHHAPINETGDNIIVQILSIADVYSALRERRSYKEPISDWETFEIMSLRADLSQKYVQILRNEMCK